MELIKVYRRAAVLIAALAGMGLNQTYALSQNNDSESWKHLPWTISNDKVLGWEHEIDERAKHTPWTAINVEARDAYALHPKSDKQLFAWFYSAYVLNDYHEYANHGLYLPIVRSSLSRCEEVQKILFLENCTVGYHLMDLGRRLAARHLNDPDVQIAYLAVQADAATRPVAKLSTLIGIMNRAQSIAIARPDRLYEWNVLANMANYSWCVTNNSKIKAIAMFAVLHEQKLNNLPVVARESVQMNLMDLKGGLVWSPRSHVWVRRALWESLVRNKQMR